MAHPEYFLYGSCGAASFELLKLYEYRAKLTGRKYSALLHSTLFWSAVVGMLAASGFIAWALYAEAKDTPIWQVVVAGIAARSVVREVAAGGEATRQRTLGVRPDETLTTRDIFL